IKASPFLIKPNLGEFCRLTGIQSENFAQISAAAKKLSEERSTSILLSMGDRGALYFENNCKGNIYKIEPLDIKVSSAMGAGDALLAGFVYTLMKKSSLKEALKKATACAAASVSMEGTQPGPLALVEQLESKVKIQEK
ncbi:MAG: PfkB family carbohydrate kinase, partial [Promethearchaeia archaeon]